MNRLVLAVVLALGVLGTASARDDDDEKATLAAQKAVLGLIGVNQPAAQAQVIAKAHSSEHVMRVFQFRKLGGLGIGAKAPDKMKDGLEPVLIDIATAKPNNPYPGPVLLAKHADDFVKLGEVSLAVAEINHFYKPKVAKPGQNLQKWQKWNDDMKTSAKDLIAAARAKNQEQLTTAATALNTTCVECHKMFR